MMKEKLMYLLVLSAITAMCRCVLADTEIVDGIEWTYTIRDGKASVGSGNLNGARAIPTSTAGSITIPSLLGNCPVTSVAAYAFCGCAKLKSVTIQSGVTEIGYEAFCSCSGLGSVEIPSSVVRIGRGAFSNCSNLGAGVVIVDGCVLCVNGESSGEEMLPVGTRLIGGGAFYNCQTLTSVVIPPSVVSIGDYAFDCCEHLTSVWIANGVKQIGRYAFSGCKTLTGVLIPGSVTNIDEYAFYACNGMTDALISEGVTQIGDSMFWGCTRLERVTIPASVTKIGYAAFDYCRNLKDVKIPNGVTHIAGETFYNCIALTNVTIPASVASIDAYAFDGCVGLGDGVVIVDDCVLTVNGACPAVVELPMETRLIGGTAFWGRSSLKNITIPNGVTDIGGQAFRQCSGLTNVEIPSSVMRIGAYAFEECSSLTNVIFRGDAPAVYTDCFSTSPFRGTATGCTATVYSDANGWGDDADWWGLVLKRIERTEIAARRMCKMTPTGWANPLAVSNDWLIANGLAKEGDSVADVAAKMSATGKNGIPRYQSYILGMEPDSDTPADEQLKVTIGGFDKDGVPVINYEPTPNDATHVTVKKLGRKTLPTSDDTGWSEVNGNESDFNFFKVKVEVK